MKNLIPIANGQATNTADDAKAYFNKYGISVNGWAREHSLSRNVVKNMLNGRGKGNHGQSHLVAIALGMKLLPEEGAVVTTEVSALAQGCTHDQG